MINYSFEKYNTDTYRYIIIYKLIGKISDNAIRKFGFIENMIFHFKDHLTYLKNSFPLLILFSAKENNKNNNNSFSISQIKNKIKCFSYRPDI